MSNYQYQLSKLLSDKFNDIEVVESDAGVTCVIPLEAWVETAKILRDDEMFNFEQCVDVCGVDYLTFGEAEWQTDGVSSTGFSRGIASKGPGRFSWHERREESSERFHSHRGEGSY